MADENQKPKKNFAAARGLDINMSTKTAASICRMIRGRAVEEALKMLEEVVQFKRVVKMNNQEAAHQHGKGVMAGKYPAKAASEFIKLAKQLRANAAVNGLEEEKCRIFCKADSASRPFKSGGRRFKRTHVLLRLEEKKAGKLKRGGKK